MASLMTQTMSSRAILFVATLAIALALCQAGHLDDDSISSSKKEIHPKTTTTTTTTTDSPMISHDVTVVPESKTRSSTGTTLHPSVTVESVKGTTGTHNVSFSNLANETPVDHMKLKADAKLDPLHRFCDYLKPICNSTDKLTSKQFGKIQNQFKRIIQVSAGKLSFCFLEHFGFDPNLDSISHANLDTICHSKNLAPDLKGSYKSFEGCAIQNWCAAVDNELDKILAARANCTTNHNHAKNETSASEVTHEDDEDEYSLISAVVNKMFEENKGQFANTSDVKFIDISGNGMHATTPKPAVHTLTSNSSKSGNDAAREAMLNDPNTVMVLMDDGGSKTTLAPLINKTMSGHHKNAEHLSHNTTTLRPINSLAAATTTTTTTEEPHGLAPSLNHTSEINVHSGKEKKLSANATDLPTTSAKISVTNTSLPSSEIAPHHETTLKPLTVEPLVKLTEAPAQKLEQLTSGSNKTIIDPMAKTKPTLKQVATTTAKPVLQTLEEIFLRQEKQKQEFEERLRQERDKLIKELQKRQDEIDARNAIRSLQFQRDASTNQHSDARLHQLEHDRQMTIDPIGHTIKHQQYEFNKQQRMMNGRK